MQSSTQIPHEPHSDLQNYTPEAPVVDSTTASGSSNRSRNFTREDVQDVQNLIERCIKLYMDKDEAVNFLWCKAKIKPGIVTLVWQRMEQHNKDFFNFYYTSLILKKQIKGFDQLLEQQSYLMTNSVHPKVPMAPMQGIHHMPSHAQIDSMSSLSSYYVVNGIPTAGVFQPTQINTGKDMVMDRSAVDRVPIFPASSIKPGMSPSPASMAYNGQLPFTQTDISELSVDTSALDSTFTSHLASPEGLQLGLDGRPGNSKESLQSLSQISQSFIFPDMEGHTQIDSMSSMSSYHVVNEIPAAGNFHPMQINSGKNMVMDRSAVDTVLNIPARSINPGMSPSPASMAYNGQFSFNQTEISELSADTSALDSTSSQIPRSSSFQDITAEWTDMEVDVYFSNVVPDQFSQCQWDEGIP